VEYAIRVPLRVTGSITGGFRYFNLIPGESLGAYNPENGCPIRAMLEKMNPKTVADALQNKSKWS
jgi:hypothetical protein